ncbi:hypothetical protein D3C87_1873730 [compost metagenome]
MVCCISMRPGLFSPISISLRTTVISLSRSAREITLLTMRSASMRSAQSRLSSLALKVPKKLVRSCAVVPFTLMPRRANSVGMVLPGSDGVPLNSRCSSRWAMPVSP